MEAASRREKARRLDRLKIGSTVEQRAAKQKSRSTTFYVIAGPVFVQNILVPLSGRPGCLSVVAGAGFEPATFGL
jgi:hypothetical protein